MILPSGRLQLGCILLDVRAKDDPPLDAQLTPDSHCVSNDTYFLDCCVSALSAFQQINLTNYRFPGLARNTPQMREKAKEFEAGDITREEYDRVDTLKRSELSNIAFYVQSVGEVFILVVIVGIMFAIDVNSSAAANNWGLSVLIAFATGVWVLLAIPWFFKEKRRAGQTVNGLILTVLVFY